MIRYLVRKKLPPKRHLTILLARPWNTINGILITYMSITIVQRLFPTNFSRSVADISLALSVCLSQYNK